MDLDCLPLRRKTTIKIFGHGYLKAQIIKYLISMHFYWNKVYHVSVWTAVLNCWNYKVTNLLNWKPKFLLKLLKSRKSDSLSGFFCSPVFWLPSNSNPYFYFFPFVIQPFLLPSFLYGKNKIKIPSQMLPNPFVPPSIRHSSITLHISSSPSSLRMSTSPLTP